MNKWYQVTMIALDSHPMKKDIPWPLEVKVDFYQEDIQDEYDAELEALGYVRFPECWRCESVIIIEKVENS